MSLPNAPDITGEVAAPRDPAAIPAPPEKPRLSMEDFFWGTDGLRAGWSLLLFAGLLFVVMLGTGFLLDKFLNSRAPISTTALLPAKTVLAGEGLSLVCIVFVTSIMAKIERRPNAAFGMGGQRRLRNFFEGLGWGAALLSLLVLCLRMTGSLVFDARLLFGASALRYGAIWLAGFLLVGLYEEFMFRGYLQFTLARGLSGIYGWLGAPARKSLGFWTSAILLSFGFGVTHRSNTGESPIGLLSAGLIGVVFCLSLWRTGSLWWAIGFHSAWDWMQSFVYGVADSGLMVQGHLFATHPVGKPIFSGGLTGPEGSLFILPIAALITLVIVRVLPRQPSPNSSGVGLQGAPDGARPPLLHLDLH